MSTMPVLKKLISVWKDVHQDSLWNRRNSNSEMDYSWLRIFWSFPWTLSALFFYFLQSSCGEPFSAQSHCNGTPSSACSVTPVCGLLPVQRGNVSHTYSFEVILDHLLLYARVKFTPSTVVLCLERGGWLGIGVPVPLLRPEVVYLYRGWIKWLGTKWSHSVKDTVTV